MTLQVPGYVSVPVFQPCANRNKHTKGNIAVNTFLSANF